MMRGVKRAVTPKVNASILWLDFNYKPDYKARNMLKSVGFRWSPDKGMWWCKNTTEARKVANKFNLTEFIAKPTPSSKDFMDWQKSLTKSDWHKIVSEADMLATQRVDEDGLQLLENMLHDKFIAQWA